MTENRGGREGERERKPKIGRGVHRYPGHDDCAAGIYSAAEPVRGIWSEGLTHACTHACTHARVYARGAVLSTRTVAWRTEPPFWCLAAAAAAVAPTFGGSGRDARDCAKDVVRRLV